MQFFRVSHNTSNTKGYSWIQTISSGLVERTCTTCSRSLTYSNGDLTVILDKNLGVKWPDVLGCGHYPFFIVSSRVIQAFQNEGMLSFPYFSVSLERPLPKQLNENDIMDYYWLDGSQMMGAKIDFEASNFIGTKFCRECGTRTYDISRTYRKQAQGFSYVFDKGSWDGKDLFTTDLSQTAFFCTDKIVLLAKKYKLTNFRFIPIEDGNGTKGIKYF